MKRYEVTGRDRYHTPVLVLYKTLGPARNYAKTLRNPEIYDKVEKKNVELN